MLFVWFGKQGYDCRMSHSLYGNKMYNKNAVALNGWAECAEGMQKSIKLIEGQGKVAPMLVLQLDCWWWQC